MVSKSMNDSYNEFVKEKIYKDMALNSLYNCGADNRLMQYWNMFNDCTNISKETFIEYMEDIKKQLKIKDEALNVLTNCLKDSYIIDLNTINLSEIVVQKMLMSMFKITEYEALNEVQYLECECDWFDDNSCSIVNSDGVEYNLSSFVDWYNYLVNVYGRI